MSPWRNPWGKTSVADGNRNAQQQGSTRRPRELSQLSSGSSRLPRRPREISQVSTYSDPRSLSQPRPRRGRRGIGGSRQRLRRPQESSGPSMASPYGQRPGRPSELAPGRRLQGARRLLPNQYTGLSRIRPREAREVSSEMPYFQGPVRTQYLQGRRPRDQNVNPPISGPYQQQQYRLSQTPRNYQGTDSRYTTDPWGRLVPYPSSHPEAYQSGPVQHPSFESSDQSELGEPELPFDHQPATTTGFTELSLGKVCLILLLWLPRFFIPWIVAWHEFNVHILSNPWHWKDREGDLLQQKTYILVGSSILAIISSLFVDLLRKKCEMEYYVYLLLLILFTTSPLTGGFVDISLRAQFFDVQEYEYWWFPSVVLAQGAISVSYAMFPVQMACIYSQTSSMSRKAHYIWTSLFLLFEFINAYIAFLIIPGPCPTKDWTQVVVWSGLGLMLITVTTLTLIFVFAVKALKHAMMMCCKRKTDDVEQSEQVEFFDALPSLMCRKLVWFSMVAVPIIWMSFSSAILEGFIPYEDWDHHHFLSARGIILFWKILGVILMALVMFVVRWMHVKRKSSSLKTERLCLGVPHILWILALVTMASRFATLSHLNEGDIILGPIPDDNKTVLVFVNSMFRNRTICLSSNHFQSVKIRPHQLVTREIYGITVDNMTVDSLTVTMEVDPCFQPAIRTRVKVENIKKGEWKIYDVALLHKNLTQAEPWDYYRTLYPYSLRGEENLRPKVGKPQLAIFQVTALAPVEYWYYQFNHSELGSHTCPTNNSAFSVLGLNRNVIWWEVPGAGNWTVKLWSNLFNKSDVAYAWATNCTKCVSPLEFVVEMNSLYLLVEYYYEESDTFALNLSYFDNPPPGIQFPMYPLSYSLFKLGEVAGPDSDRLPSNTELIKDWAVITSMALAGMAAGGIFLGFIYMLWIDPPVPSFRTTTLAICWVLMGVAAAMPRFIPIEVDVDVSLALLTLQLLMTGLHFIGASFMYSPALDFRLRPD